MKKNLLLNFFKLIKNIFPECSLKNKILCLYYTYFEKNNFKIYYKKYFFVTFNGFSLKFYWNPYPDTSTFFKNYLKKYNIKKKDIVIDAGTYVGTCALIASKLVGDKGKIIAFEPDKENYKKLLDNIKLNNITNIITINKGLWSKNKVLKFNKTYSEYSSFFFDKDELNHAIFLPNTPNIPKVRSKFNHVVSVPVVMLDTELKKLKINKIDFIKMDIEGAEIEAIKGCKKILKNQDVKLAIASYHILNGQKTCYKLEKLLTELGYNTETSSPEHLTTYASK